MKECLFLEADNQKEWADIWEFCTSKWMTILISHRTYRYNKLPDQVQQLIQEIISHYTLIQSSWLDILMKNTKKDEDDLIHMKLGTFR